MNKPALVAVAVLLTSLSALACRAQAPGPATPTDSDQQLQQAVEMVVRRGQQADGITRLRGLLASGALDGRQSTRALTYLAIAYQSEGQDSLALEAFKSVARADPYFTPADLSLREGEDPPIELVAPFCIAVVKVRQEEMQTRNAQLAHTKRRSAAVRSLLVPGWGHLYEGHRGRGYLLMGLTVASTAACVWTDLSFRDARSAYRTAPPEADFDRLYRQYRQRAHSADVGLGVLGGLWAYGALDAVLIGPNLMRSRVSLRPGASGGGITLVCSRAL
jgi:hypothetical protein